MLRDDYERSDATALAERVRRREIEPLALIDRALARIAAVDPHIGAVVAIDPEGARRAARQVSLDAPFAGLPILIKDTSVDVAGMPTRHGSKSHADALPLALGQDIENHYHWMRRRPRIAGADSAR